MKQFYTFILSIFVSINFYSQSTICDNPTLFCGGIFQIATSTNSPSIGSLGCLSTSPNPNWFVFQVGNSGNLIFDLHQGNNSPDYNNLDVDFICWGPFSSVPDCNTELYQYNGNTSIINNIIACSYSTSSTETITIPNALSGEYYIVLTTNFSNNSGILEIEQTNISVPGAGNVNCEIVCGVTLGPDRIFCTETGNNLSITASFIVEPTYSSSSTFEWYLNNVLQPSLTTQTILINQSGIWKAKVTRPGCTGPVEDEVMVEFNLIGDINSNPFSVNGPINNCNPIFNLNDQGIYILNGLNSTDYTIVYYLDLMDLFSESNPILNPEAFSISQNTTIYASIISNNSICSTYTEFLLDVDCPSTEIIFDTQPQDQTINPNTNTTFIANILNATTYSWQMSTNGGVTWITIVNGGTNPVFNGADTNTLSLENVPANYDGNMFRVVATSITDLQISDSAELFLVLSNSSFELTKYTIYPNPVKNNFTLKINGDNLTKDLKYKIFDVNGRIILEKEIVSLETIIPFEKYESGVYLIEVSTQNLKTVDKLIKN